MSEEHALAVAALNEALRTAARYGEGHVSITVGLAHYIEVRLQHNDVRQAFADAFMVHPTGRMNDADVLAVLDGLE